MSKNAIAYPPDLHESNGRRIKNGNPQLHVKCVQQLAIAAEAIINVSNMADQSVSSIAGYIDGNIDLFYKLIDAKNELRAAQSKFKEVQYSIIDKIQL